MINKFDSPPSPSRGIIFAERTHSFRNISDKSLELSLRLSAKVFRCVSIQGEISGVIGRKPDSRGEARFLPSSREVSYPLAYSPTAALQQEHGGYKLITRVKFTTGSHSTWARLEEKEEEEEEGEGRMSLLVSLVARGTV